ncbi:HamA C-terminal domain-containing protein [Pontibacter arcticus]|nr:DUF1837 domain-containing protein [Pontibacter arcticus]
MPIKEDTIHGLLASTKALLNKMYFIEDSFDLGVNNRCIGTCINYSDLLEMQDEFIEELVATVLRYVYSKRKQNQMKAHLINNEERDEDNAFSILQARAKSKFRKADVKGQISELLIYNLLQHHFKAVPILRKMPLTTNPELERNGADAIHLGVEGGKVKIYIGECKTSDRETGAFNYALTESIKDVILHYKSHRNEMNLYVYEDFIPEELEDFVQKYLNGDITDVQVNLVCMVSYGNKDTITGNSREEKLEDTIEKVRNAVRSINRDILHKKIDSALKPRIHVLIFPINEMNSLLEKFSKKIG